MMGIISVSNVSPCILAIMKHLLVLYRCYYMDNHSGVTTHLEPDILECEVKWALGSITMNKAGGGDGIPAELFLLHQFLEITLLLSVLMNLTTPDTQFKWNHRIFVLSCQVYFT